MVPGVVDALTARIAERTGFDTVYVSGAACSASLGLPDMGVMTFTELHHTVASIRAATDLDIVVDLDTGYGGVAALRRSVQSMADLGVAAVHIEDQSFPKRTAHLEPSPPVDAEEMCRRIEAARSASDETLVVARTDALKVLGFDEAVRRARTYADAGADLVLVNSISTLDDLGRLAQAVPGPKAYYVAGSDSSPRLDVETARELGVALVIYPLQPARAAASASARYLRQLHDGMDLDTPLMPFKEYFSLAGWDAAEDFERSLGTTQETHR